MTAARPAPWDWDPCYVHELVAAHLGRFLGAIGAGRPVSWLRRPAWWGGVRLPDDVRRLHGLDAGDALQHHLTLLSAPTSRHLLVIDLATGDWREPSLDLAGQGFMSLAARRWGLSETKAAWRWARLCGVPVPRLP